MKAPAPWPALRASARLLVPGWARPRARPRRLSGHARASAAQARSGGPRQGTTPQRWPNSRPKGKWPDNLCTETPSRAMAPTQLMRTQRCSAWTKGGPPARRGNLRGGAAVQRCIGDPSGLLAGCGRASIARPGKAPRKERRTNRTTGSLRSASAKAKEAGCTRDAERTQGGNSQHDGATRA